MEDYAAIGMHGIHQVRYCAQRSDNQWYFMLLADGEVGLHARIALVNYQVHAIGRVVIIETFFRLDDPVLEFFGRALVQRRKRAGHAGLAGGFHQLRSGDQKHRRADRGQRQTAFETLGQRHGGLLSLFHR